MTAKGATIVFLAHANKYRDGEGKLIPEGTNEVTTEPDETVMIEFQKNESTEEQVISFYPDKVRTLGMKKCSFKLDLKSQEIEPIEFVDLVEINSGSGSVAKKMTDTEIEGLIIDAIKSGLSKQSDILDWCISKGGPVQRSLTILKSGGREGNPHRFLETLRKPKENNAIYYALFRESNNKSAEESLTCEVE